MTGSEDMLAGDAPAGRERDLHAAPGPSQTGDRVGGKIDRLLDAVYQRERQMQNLLAELSKFPAAAEGLSESVQVQVDLANSLDELLAGLADRNEELAGMIRSVSETAAEQSEILHKVEAALTARDRTEERIVDALDRLTAAMTTRSPDVASHLGMMEQIRQNIGKSGLAIEKAAGDLAAGASQSRQETAASLDRLAEAIRQMPQSGEQLSQFLQRMDQATAGFAKALSASGAQMTQKLSQAGEQATGGAEAAARIIAQSMDKLFEDYDRRAASTEKALTPLAMANQRVIRLVQHQNKLLGWLLGMILLAVVALICFVLWRPPRVTPVPVLQPVVPAQTQPAR